MKKLYININDYQGGSWAMGQLGTIKDWQKIALEWCDSDENWGLYDEIKNHKLNEELLKIINEIWTIEIVEFNRENLDKILDNYSRNEYYWLLQDIMERLEV